jgi:hypothetical protein
MIALAANAVIIPLPFEGIGLYLPRYDLLASGMTG